MRRTTLLLCAIAALLTTDCSLLNDADPVPVIRVTPGLAGAFAGQGGTLSFRAALSDNTGNPVATTHVEWAMVTPSASVTVDTAGVVTVAAAATAGDYAVRAASAGVAAIATVRVLPRLTGWMVFSATVAGNGQIFIKDFATDTDPVQLTTGAGSISGLAADGTTGAIFFGRSVTGSDLFRINFDGSGLANLSNDAPSFNQVPTIHPVSHDVYFSRRVSGVAQVFRMKQDGSQLTQLTTGGGSKTTPAVSPNGASLAWTEIFQPNSNQDIVSATIDGGSQVRLEDRTGSDGSPLWLTNSRIMYAAIVTGAGANFEIFQVDSPLGDNLANLTNSTAGESQPSAACTSNALTILSTAGGQNDAYHWDLSTMLTVRYQLGSTSPALNWARRVCQ